MQQLGIGLGAAVLIDATHHPRHPAARHDEAPRRPELVPAEQARLAAEGEPGAGGGARDRVTRQTTDSRTQNRAPSPGGAIRVSDRAPAVAAPAVGQPRGSRATHPKDQTRYQPTPVRPRGRGRGRRRGRRGGGSRRARTPPRRSARSGGATGAAAELVVQKPTGPGRAAAAAHGQLRDLGDHRRQQADQGRPQARARPAARLQLRRLPRPGPIKRFQKQFSTRSRSRPTTRPTRRSRSSRRAPSTST